ncbi:MAG: ribosome maturation factor RimP [Endomicrobia bacterium]|nr:ribosome maturation factor RimP [Endomicrobiia bacterium]MCX7716004.1 ribosome maturation factor RimP [Endomicrobiia bacterium]
MNKNLIDKITEIVEPVLESKNYELVEVEYKPTPEGKVLTIYIDKDGGVSLQDCEDVSILLSSILDSYDFIKEHYFLEVSSPGIYRELKKEKDFQRYLGHRIKVKLYESINVDKLGKQKVLIGKLKEYTNNFLTMVLDNNFEVSIETKFIAKVNLEPNITDLLNNE